jgi:hypothetical protein
MDAVVAEIDTDIAEIAAPVVLIDVVQLTAVPPVAVVEIAPVDPCLETPLVYRSEFSA